MATGAPVSVKDRLGRPLRDLRISVTDRCNFRCPYCMPAEVFGKEYAFLPRDAILTFEEIVRFVRVAAAHGVTKVRLTGGEPTVRRDIERLVAMVAAVPGVFHRDHLLEDFAGLTPSQGAKPPDAM